MASDAFGRLPAAHAVTEAFDWFELLTEAGGYIAERADNHLDDIRARVVAVLTGSPLSGVPERSEPFVWLAIDVAGERADGTGDAEGTYDR